MAGKMKFISILLVIVALKDFIIIAKIMVLIFVWKSI